MTDEPQVDADPPASASLAVLDRHARSPIGRLTVWLAASTLAVAGVAGCWMLLRGFEAARHRPPSGLLEMFEWIIGS